MTIKYAYCGPVLWSSSLVCSTLTYLEQETNSELKNLCCWLKANNLSLNVAKTEFIVIGSRQKILAEHYDDISIKLLDQVDHAKFLGVVIDNPLSWSNHVDEILKADYDTGSNLLLEILKWHRLEIRRKKQKATMMLKSLNELAPMYLWALFNERSTKYDLCNSFCELTLPRPRTDYLKRSLC